MNEDTTEIEKIKFSFANEDEKVLGIETGTYNNGNQIKRVMLDNGKTAIVRELLGKDMRQAETLAGGVQENFTTAMMALATKIDGKQLPFEDYDLMKARHFTKIKAAVGLLNF